MLFRRKKKEIKIEKREVPKDVFVKCPSCGEIIYRNQLEKNLHVCPVCNYHFRIRATDFVKILFDGGEFEEKIGENLETVDVLEFPDYKAKLEKSKKKTGLKEAAIAGTGKIGGFKVVLFVTDFGFLGGSMGSVYGEIFYRAATRAVELGVPLISLTSSGGGARMHEGIFSLMQMAKTTVGVTKLEEAKIPFISVLSDPTMGGVMASFAALGDVIIAEPHALLGFAGPRVIKQTIGEDLPEGFQTSEFLLEHGMIDMVVDRRQLKDTLIKVLDHLLKGEYGKSRA